ncbi:hypothetical protein IPG41_02920 [Candidatus Peregrinibacteria bacterium]|nr:MAG: hypothetical protein IPG41_02920 [Candidatus Peregrinibacteria bacterium]
MKIQPVEYALFCDYASVSMDGKINMNGIFERILAEKTPVTHPQMFVVSRLILPKGKHSVTFTLMQQDKVLAKSNFEKEIPNELGVHNHFWSIQGLKIEAWDPLELQILIEGKQVFVKRLPIIKVERKGKDPNKAA